MSNCLLLGILPVSGQSLRKMERQAINRTHLTFVNGDTVQRFTITQAHPTPSPGRFYYWQGPTQILRTAGAYNGKLLTGPYQLTSRNGNLLGSGTFKNGVKTGFWRTWREDGIPLTSSHWRRGRQRGRLATYDESGRLLKPARDSKPIISDREATQNQRLWQLSYWKNLVKRRKARRNQGKSVPVVPPAVSPATAPSPNRPGS